MKRNALIISAGKFANIITINLLCFVILAACVQTDGNKKASAPIPASTLALMESKGIKPSDNVLMRVVKADSKLEVWKKSSDTGKYIFLKSYDICKWSGDLGPKKFEGDRQAPEGFYEITPAQMNPNSSYYLSFNIGFPNNFDKVHNRTGSHLMVHGDCTSRGCYAMSDENISEIYAIARESFRGGQKSFQFQALPFQMTAKNMFKFRNSQHYAFWQNLKEGVDQFKVSGLEPKVDVCSKKYVFNAQGVGRFDPTAECPSYTISKEIELAWNVKKAADEAEIHALMQEDLKKASGLKLTSIVGIHLDTKVKIDPVIAVRSVSKEAARVYLPNSSPEAVSLLAYHHTELPHELQPTENSFETQTYRNNSAIRSGVKQNEIKSTNAKNELLTTVTRPSITEPNEQIALMSPDAYVTPSIFQITK